MRPKDLYAITEALGAEGHGLKASCALLGVSASGFFYWRARPMPAARCSAGVAGRCRRGDLGAVPAHLRVAARPGRAGRGLRSPRQPQPAAGRSCASSTFAAYPAARGRRRDLSRAHTAADLVNREFDRDGPNQLWMTDITEHPTREGKLYVCAVLDAWSRKVVGWSIDRKQTAAMVNSALAMAIDT